MAPSISYPRLATKLAALRPPLPWHRVRARPGAGERVVLLHGLWRSYHSMELLARVLNEQGYETVNMSYPSFRRDLPALTEHLREHLPPSSKTTHVVTHSMGAILVRQLMAETSDLLNGRMVMLAAPNQGSEVIDWFSRGPVRRMVARVLLGTGGMALSTPTVRGHIPPLPVGREFSIIMGKRATLPFFQTLLPGENDGIVTVNSGHHPGASEFKVVDADHTMIALHPEVLSMVPRFLDQGSFD